MQDGKPYSRKDVKPLVTTPNDLPWKLLRKLLDSSDQVEASEKAPWYHAIRSRDVEELLTLADHWSPQSIMAQSDPLLEQFQQKYQLSAFLKKYPFKGNEKARKAKALEGFLQAEQNCADFNATGWTRISSLDPEFIMEEALPLMRDFIRRVLGENVSIDKCLESARHGPGGTLSTKGNKITQYYKWSEFPYTVTASALPYARYLIESDERWIAALYDRYRTDHDIPQHYPVSPDHMFEWAFEVVPGNRITFVPKDGRKDRPIAIEPLLNVMLQLGVDGYIRKALKPFGCDLDSQAKNQHFAELGSSYVDDRRFSTIDLSAASDSVSLKLCELLLPREWYALLLDLRSPVGLVKGPEGNFSVKYEKISSMGNGYTFVLESLIFLAASYAAGKIADSSLNIRKDVAVYGDDIIVPQRAALAVIEILNHCGFATNNDKTFVTGVFKESCGSDFFQGCNIRPVFLKEEVTSVKDLFSLANSCMLTQARAVSYGNSAYLSQVVESIKSWIPSEFKHLVGPLSTTEFDSYLHTPLSQKPSSMKYRHDVVKFTRLVTVPARFNRDGKQFFFRKLMANLRQSEVVQGKHSAYQELDERSTGGSVFTITRRNALRYAYVDARVSYWPETYDEARRHDNLKVDWTRILANLP